MSFISDKQTIDELSLLGKYRAGSVYSLFNKVKTNGGERMLEQMLRDPLTEAASINERTAVLRHFGQAAYTFPFDGETTGQFASWLDMGSRRTAAGAFISTYAKKVLAGLTRDGRYRQSEEGTRAAAGILKDCHAFIAATPSFGFYDSRIDQVRKIMTDGRLQKLLSALTAKLQPKQIAFCEYLLKKVLVREMETLLSFIYELDVYIALSAVARERGFCYATAKDRNSNELKVKGLRHPALSKAVGNDLTLTGSQNLLFLTGANMAGKSTLMKSIGIALYLAHAGFPVAADEMAFSVMDGLYSSINIPDNISLGYSHFYAEVLRVKQAAQLVAGGKRMLVMFDELFKGTNVKDAYDGTLAVTEAFARYRDCLFIISTHIIEVGEALQNNANIRFGYMPTVMDGAHPRYPYTLTKGITSDRHGMLIIENEGILDIIQTEK
jgi:DNA mismatch repair protein MutS